MKIEELRKQQIYETIEDPNLTKDEKVANIAIILNKTEAELLMDCRDKAPKRTLEDIYRSLFQKKTEGEEYENNKVK